MPLCRGGLYVDVDFILQHISEQGPFPVFGEDNGSLPQLEVLLVPDVYTSPLSSNRGH